MSVNDIDSDMRIVSTKEAAALLNRRPQTLRAWSCLQNGPIRPMNINGRLAWRMSDIRKLLQVDSYAPEFPWESDSSAGKK